MEGVLQLQALFNDPPVDGGVIHVHPAFEHELFDMARAQGVRHIPANPHENDVLREMSALEADHPCSPSLVQSQVSEGEHT